MRGKFQRWRRAAGLALALGGAVPAAGCGGEGASQPPLPATCPRIGILGEAADLVRYRPGAGQDLSALELEARVTGFQARCDYVNRGRAMEVRLTVGLQAERGPAARAASAELPWFVAVTDAGEEAILNKREFVTRVGFPPNVGRARATSEEISVTLPLGQGRDFGDYALLVGFQLTPEELALNRRRGLR
ncbi:hypothetical protein [Caldovatus aquaticus]|uniref:DUF4352 domain-containing protein n=1 Tax=Caldovatus aquaticus TaxID=2865671 RepID=A0ABS7EZV3_9PROT|nr:hypothetical protein [Caldovatus aquaticus]MBW8268101.1 hypothetical protein [Caldovatus aquaticus]